MRKSKMPLKGVIIRVLLIIGFLVMEFPGVLFFKDLSHPYIVGLPFAYGIMLIGWIYMCIVLLWAYKCNWGEDNPKGGDNK